MSDMNWEERFNHLSDSELYKIAIVRVMECTNGVIQHAFRDDVPYKLSVDDTRSAMNYSMSSIKNMRVPLDGKDITFDKDTEELLKDIRDLYVSGVKRGNENDFKEFIKASSSSVRAVGYKVLVEAREELRYNCINKVIAERVDWGFNYLTQFLTEDDV